MSITQITAGLIADGAVTANTLNSTQTFTVNNLTVTNTASVVTLVFADNTVQTTAYTGTNAQAYDQSLNTFNSVTFTNVTVGEGAFIGGSKVLLNNSSGTSLVQIEENYGIWINYDNHNGNPGWRLPWLGGSAGQVLTQSGFGGIAVFRDPPGTNYDQSLNTYDDVIFHDITSTGTISSENFYVGGTEGGSTLYNNNGEFLISNGGHDMMTINFNAQYYNDQEVGAVTFNSGRFGISNEATGPMIEALPDKTTFYTPIVATTASFNDTVNIVNTLTVGNYSIAPVDGVAGQALVTDGMGNVSFQNIVPSLDFGSFIAPAGFTLDMGRFI
ncbi:hypothetical protein UFOVP94_3 [uncultured Caudovirales phage]|uniref:Uncharacterized protein n=1 Tax=uncultured Caudovirales phage TaxID=2100421 RepID=A0A6J7WG28_9CAUD|nr:hypothetical protein UFOVP94_3 [uncultured Caudovirales phage]CAB5212658.1 hypothetical protein UFOVP186_40 [uncultured Caudovirales phage]